MHVSCCCIAVVASASDLAATSYFFVAAFANVNKLINCLSCGLRALDVMCSAQVNAIGTMPAI